MGQKGIKTGTVQERRKETGRTRVNMKKCKFDILR